MKKINFVVLILIIFSISQNKLYSQYVLGLGNFWIYESEYSTSKIAIVDTATLFDSIFCYRYVHIPLKNSNYVLNKEASETKASVEYFIHKREDGIFEEFIVYNAVGDTSLQPYLYKENAQLGEKWIYFLFTEVDTAWMEVRDVFEGMQFGYKKKIKYLYLETGLNSYFHYFCDDFGEISVVHDGEVIESLKGCYINGVAYGDTSYTTVDIKETENAILNYQLNQNYPNPFNPTTVISFRSPKSGNVSLVVYDILGNKIATLVDKYFSAGKYSISFSPSSNGLNLTSGVYFYRLISGNYQETKKMIYLQ